MSTTNDELAKKIIENLNDRSAHIDHDDEIMQEIYDEINEAIKANYRHINDIRGAIPEKMDFDDPELAEHNKEFTAAYNHAIDNIRQALNIGDK